MMKMIRPALLSVILFTVLTGILYPITVTGIAHLLFPVQANGSIILRNGKAAGSELIGQPFDDPAYFWGRPSATLPFPYNSASSSGSNLAQTNPDLVKSAKGRIDALRDADPQAGRQVPVDLVTASGSGLDLRDWLWSVIIVVACTAIATIMSPYFSRVDLAMVYLLGVVFAASRTGKGPSLLATVLSVAAFDFFFVPPYYSFAVSDVRYIVTFIVMFVVAFVISRLTLRVREQARAARLRERRTAALYNLSSELVHERDIEGLSAAAIRHVGESFTSQVVVLVPDDKGSLAIPATGPGTFALDQRELSVAQWTFDHRERAGLGTDTLPGAQALYLPLTAASRTVGVIGILPDSSVGSFDHEQVHILESFANQTAMAIERALLGEEAQQALVKAEAETLRNTLLSSVSHDLRTPLATITGASTTLLQRDVALDQSSRLELIRTISEEAERLNRIIQNVLDMTRLESEAINVNKEWQSLEEIVDAVLNRLADKLKGHPLTTRLQENLPLVPFDPLLIEQVLINLLDNALRYTPQETPLELSATIKGDSVMVELADRGPGIHPGEEERIFQKFVRGYSTGGGIGLGLAICRAIVAAHGGRIWAENRPGGGAVFRFTLPVGVQPKLPEPEEEM